MQFLHFGLLPYFLPLVLIPLALHLLTLQRLKTVELSTFRFLFDTYVQQRRKMKLMEALIVFLRTLFVLFLILCIARPVVKRWQSLFVGGAQQRDVVILVDASASMGAVTDGETSLQRAKRAASEIVDRLGADERVTIVRVGAVPKEVCSRFSSDAKKIQGEIDSIEASPSQANLYAAVSLVFGETTRNFVKPAVYVMTDLQTSTWSEFQQGNASDLLPENAEIRVVNVGTNQEMPNLAVHGTVDDTQVVAGLPTILRPRVANYSDEDADDIELTVVINDKEVARKSLALKAGETEELEITYQPRDAGTLRGRFQIAADRFTMDDSFLFTIDVEPRVKILLVNGNPSTEPSENAGLYVRTAITSSNESDGEEPLAEIRAPEQEQFRKSIDIVELPEPKLTQATLKDVDVVVLADCGALNANHCRWISEAVADGTGLLILPGAKVKPELYNKVLFPASTNPDEQLVRALLGPMVGDPMNPETYTSLDTEQSDMTHPILSVFSDADQEFFARVEFYRRFQLTLPERAAGASILARFADGNSALVETRFGNGRVLLSSYPFHGAATNLPLKPEFVPLVLRMMSYVRRPAAVSGPGTVAADGTAEFIVSQHWAPAKGKVIDTKGRETSVSLQRSNSRLVGAFDGTNDKGFYEVKVTGGRPEQPKNGELSFAVNVAEGESKFEVMSRPAIQSVLPGLDVRVIDASAEAQQQYGLSGDEREIWRPLIILLLIIIAAEFLLSTTRGASEDRGDRVSARQRLRNMVSGDQEFVDAAN